jgi:predicted transglutaminase-like cysteine proteinase
MPAMDDVLSTLFAQTILCCVERVVEARAMLKRMISLTLAGMLLCPSAGQAWDAPLLMRQAQRHGARTVDLAQALVETVQMGQRMDDERRLELINQFFNRRIYFADDTEVWGVVDHWATPLEMFSKGQGDCEDYAIGKYFSLLAAGVQPAKLRLVYVRATLGGVGGVQQAHMVLAYYAAPTAEPLILDNLIGEIRPASRRPDLQPVFSFNADGLWQGTNGPGSNDPGARLSRWRDVLIRAREQGLF